MYILPFVSSAGDEDQVCFGLGLSRLMIRNLMLLRDVSIHGPEDTASVPVESASILAAQNSRSSFVTGVADFGSKSFTLEATTYRPGRPAASTTVEERDFSKFLRKCTRALGRCLDSALETTVDDAWKVGQPRDEESLLRCGALQLHFDRADVKPRARAAKDALAEDPDFVLPAWEIDEDLPSARKIYLRALENDPYNAQLCFTTFCNVWRSQGPQPEAVQFCRKAIELSPGHGKAHMCAPHAAPANADMLHHSELGYRLLPGNSFAVNNYILNLDRYGSPADKLMELAEEGMATDPCDPGNYQRLIELHCSQEDYPSALAVAEKLQLLFEPEVNERTLYCLRQNPERARELDTGEYDPAADNKKLIAKLRRQMH